MNAGSAPSRFRFVQLDIPGRLGLDDGRYLLRESAFGPVPEEKPDEESPPHAVLVVETLGGVPTSRGRARRRPRSRPAERAAAPPEVPLTRLTVIPAEPLEAGSEASWLATTRGNSEAVEAALADALRVVNAAVHAHGVATQDPYVQEVGAGAALATRIGYGTGAGLADGRWEEATEVTLPARRQRRAQALRPQERLAAVLGGRESLDACETLLLRARADLDADRHREAALQLRAGLDALLAELADRAGPDQEEDLAALQERRAATEQTASEALRGELSADRSREVAATLAICERVLRRRQILSGES